MNPPPALVYEQLLRRALEEDLGVAGDRTTDAVVPSQARTRALVVARQPGRVAGLTPALAVFHLLDPGVTAKPNVSDGHDVTTGTVLAEVEGAARTILTAERTALNFLGHLSGVATATAAVVAAISHSPARVLSTRKTTPGLRALEKYAVRVGGGGDHRFGLDDAILVKDNHIAIAGSLEEAVRRAQAAAGHLLPIEVEVDTLDQLDEVLALGVTAVLLDNMTLDELRQAVALARGQALTEASGGVTLETAAEIAATGVDFISIGWLTHSAPCLDVALDLQP